MPATWAAEHTRRTSLSSRSACSLGATAVLDVSIYQHTVELRVRGTLVDVTDRKMLRRWVRRPDGIYVRDQIPVSLLRSGVVETLRKYLCGGGSGRMTGPGKPGLNTVDVP